VRRLWIGLAGLGGLALWRRRRARPALTPLPGGREADELRAKLAQAREAAGDRDEFEAGETTVDHAEPSVDERRRAVHDEARGAIDEMRRD
jgi:hypothetical protein